MANEGKKKVSEAQKRLNREYVKNTYERLTVRFRKEHNMLKTLDKHAEEYGYVDENSGLYSKAELARRAIETQMAIDRGELRVVKPRKKKEEK